MADAEEVSTNEKPSVSKYPFTPPPPFVEVTCKSSGKVRRFAAGTEAKFAVSILNRKLEIGNPLALHIQAVKQGEEPVSFGPNALLVDYGIGWKLETVILVEGRRRGGMFNPTMMHDSSATTDSNDAHIVKEKSRPAPGATYFGRILLALILIFFLGAIFTLALENLPTLILYFNSSM